MSTFISGVANPIERPRPRPHRPRPPKTPASFINRPKLTREELEALREERLQEITADIQSFKPSSFKPFGLGTIGTKPAVIDVLGEKPNFNSKPMRGTKTTDAEAEVN